MNAHFNAIDAVRSARVGHGFVWSEDEDRLLASLYRRARWSALLARFPGRTQGGIQQHAAKLGIDRHANRKPAWTGAEEKTLCRLFERATWDEVCQALPRHSRSAIRNRATGLRLRRPARTKLQSRYALIRELRRIRRDGRQTMGDLAARIGVHKSRVQFWELGVSVPRLPMLFDWIEALGCKLKLESRQNPGGE